MMARRDDQLLEFPCSFAIKAMGLAEDDFDALVVSLVRQHVDDLGGEAVSSKPSSAGKYLSVTVTIEAQNREQLDNIYRSLHAHERVLMAL
jgi:putative lipoic acid-binding regulatory protein